MLIDCQALFHINTYYFLSLYIYIDRLSHPYVIHKHPAGDSEEMASSPLSPLVDLFLFCFGCFVLVGFVLCVLGIGGCLVGNWRMT